MLKLTELLEIPQLLEACIHNELFEEAMDMIQFAKEIFRPEKKNSNTNFIITTLLREIGQMTELLREKLLQKLREDLQLAFCVRVVSYLRRVDALKNQTSITTYEYECKLKEEFLTSRTIWLNSLTRGIATMDPYQYVRYLLRIVVIRSKEVNFLLIFHLDDSID
jgi:DNA-directed RNA polymerase